MLEFCEIGSPKLKQQNRMSSRQRFFTKKKQEMKLFRICLFKQG